MMVPLYSHHAAPDTELSIIFFLIILLVVLFSWYFSRRAIVLRNLRRADAKKISSFVDGDKGKIVGKIIFAGETLTAPFSGRKCSYYYLKIEEYRDGARYRSWHTIHKSEKK